MSRITSATGYEDFVKECRFFFCDDIYEGDWDGKEKYIIASDTPEEVLISKYPKVMKALSPYFFCNAECGELYMDSQKNIDKFYKRIRLTTSFGSEEEIQELTEQREHDCWLAVQNRLLIEECLSVCTKVQRERIVRHFLHGETLKAIANGKNISSVKESIDSGIRKIREFYGIDP